MTSDHPPTFHAAPARPRPSVPRPLLRCPTCQRVELRPAETVRTSAPGGWPDCCGRPMAPAPPAPGLVRDPDADATPWADRRSSDRRPAGAGARVEVRPAGQPRDIGIALLDLSATGLKLAVRAPLGRGTAAYVCLRPPGGSREYSGGAVVRWCVPGAEGTAVVGLQLRRPLTAEEVAELSV